MSDYFIGLTGGIASGKSALEKAFAKQGVVVADADLLAREVVAPGEPALAAVVEHFGADVLQADGQLDRAALRVRVFGDPGQRRVAPPVGMLDDDPHVGTRRRPGQRLVGDPGQVRAARGLGGVGHHGVGHHGVGHHGIGAHTTAATAAGVRATAMPEPSRRRSGSA